MKLKRCRERKRSRKKSHRRSDKFKLKKVMCFDFAKREEYEVFEFLKANKDNFILISTNSLSCMNLDEIQENVLIIGGSQGIGSDVFNILRNNKKIFKIVTYYKNKINLKDKKIVIKKIDIEKNIKIINQIISNYSPIKIFYFPGYLILMLKIINQISISME